MQIDIGLLLRRFTYNLTILYLFLFTLPYSCDLQVCSPLSFWNFPYVANV